MAWTRVWFLVALLGGVPAVLPPPMVEAQSSALFTAVNALPPPGPFDDIALRSRVVTVDLEQLDRAQAAADAPLSQTPSDAKDASPPTDKSDAAPVPGATLTLNLFDDSVVTGIVEWTAPTFSGGYSVSGRLVGDPLGSMTLVVNGERVLGTVQAREGTYRIHSIGTGLSAISEVEEPPLECEVEAPHSETDHQH